LDGQATQTSDDQAELIRHFDPVHLSLHQIETLQQLLAAAAASRRALDHSPEFDPAIPYLPAHEVGEALETGISDDDTGTYHRGGEHEIDWRRLDPEGLAQQAEIDAVLASMRQQSPLPPAGEGDSRPSASGVRAGPNEPA
jgi:hypothetical protein